MHPGHAPTSAHAGGGTWYELCHNPQAIAELYTAGEGLDRVRLFEAVLGRYGLLRLRVELARFPDRPPARWGREANAVQATVDFWFVDDLQVDGWSDEAAGRLSLTRDGDRLRVAFESDTVRISARCVLARIDRFSAYTREPPDEVP